MTEDLSPATVGLCVAANSTDLFKSSRLFHSWPLETTSRGRSPPGDADAGGISYCPTVVFVL